MAFTKISETTEHMIGSVVIADTESLSDTFPSGGRRLVKVQQPAITSAVLTFQVQLYPDGDFVDLYNDDGTEVSTSVASAAAQTFIIPQLAGVHALKIRTGTSGSPVAQSGGDTFIVDASGGKLS